MKCQNCGFNFDGIFCPECGTKHFDVIEKEKTEELKREKERIAQEKLEEKKIAKEKVKYEVLEKEREKLYQIEKEKKETQRILKERLELEARTYNGVVYRTEEEARIAKEENIIVDALKQRLMNEKNQNKRREIMDDFQMELKTLEAKRRMELLKIKVTQDKPKSILYNWIYAVTIICAIIITILMGSYNKMDNWFFVVVVLWYGIGIPVWVVWKIILLFKKKSSNYYLNINKI